MKNAAIVSEKDQHAVHQHQDRKGVLSSRNKKDDGGDLVGQQDQRDHCGKRNVKIKKRPMRRFVMNFLDVDLDDQAKQHLK